MVIERDLRTWGQLLQRVNAAKSGGATLASSEALDRRLTTAFGLADQESLQPVSQVPDDTGGVIRRFAQEVGGVPVWGRQVVVRQDETGKVTHLHGTLVQSLASAGVAPEASFTPAEAIARVQVIVQDGGEGDTFESESARLVVHLGSAGEARLAYEVRMHAETTGETRPRIPVYLLDAETGRTLERYDDLQTISVAPTATQTTRAAAQPPGSLVGALAPAEGTGPGGNVKTGRWTYGGDRPTLDVRADDGGNFVLQNDRVTTVNLNHGTSGDAAHRFEGPENSFKEINGAYCPLNDAHHFGGAVFRMYRDWYGRAPLSGTLTLGVHYGTNYENAFWSPAQRRMAFGDGYRRFHPLVSADVVAHEVSHGFTQAHSGLIYANQSGGINEAFSDMAGEAVETFLTGTCDYRVGAQIFKRSGAALRYMDDPAQDGRSIGHAREYREGMDVHHSSGVFNRVFYLLSKEAGWGPQLTFGLFLRANVYYWTPNSTFVSAARGVRDAGQDLELDDQAIVSAFRSVGIELEHGVLDSGPRSSGPACSAPGLDLGTRPRLGAAGNEALEPADYAALEASDYEALEAMPEANAELSIEPLRPSVSSGGDQDPVLPAEHARFHDPAAGARLDGIAGNPRLYPNGAGTVTWPVRVTDQRGRPVPGVLVEFAVAALQPTGSAWRSESGVVARYGSKSQAKVRQQIRNGQIRLLGTMRQARVTTNNQGVAEGVYQVSHVAGNAPSIGQERITASINGSNAAVTVDIGYDWLAPIPTVSKGLRIVGATGTHVHRDLAPRLRRLGEAVQSAGWPQPVTITAGNLRWGGLYPPHLTHRWGAELDLRPMTTNGAPGRWDGANYDRERTQILVDALRQLGASTIYFNDPKLQNVAPLAGHDDHLHASFAAAVQGPTLTSERAELRLG